jgi:hypothetical protein
MQAERPKGLVSAYFQGDINNIYWISFDVMIAGKLKKRLQKVAVMFRISVMTSVS